MEARRRGRSRVGAGPRGKDTPGASFALGAHPNPFNPAVRITYEMPRAGRLVLRVHDLRGRLVRTLLDQEVPAGPGDVRWDGRDAQGSIHPGVVVAELRHRGLDGPEQVLRQPFWMTK